jgi:hypothetical protein
MGAILVACTGLLGKRPHARRGGAAGMRDRALVAARPWDQLSFPKNLPVSGPLWSPWLRFTLFRSHYNGMSMPEQLQQLNQFYQNAFRWLDQNIDLFDPLKNENGSTSLYLYQTKALGELGLLCMLYHRCSDGILEPTVERFLSFIYSAWQRPAYQENIVRRPEYFQIYAMIYIVLQQCKIINDSYKGIIQRTLDQGYITATETTPMRLLDRRHLLDCGKFNHNLPSYEELYKNTLLAKNPPLFYLTDADVYAITHTLFYLTDFGRASAPMLAGEHLSTIQWIIETLLGVYLRRKHWDLVGELLLCCLCIHWYPDIIFTLAWEALMKNQLPDGSIPGPRFSEEQASKKEGAQRKQYCFEQNYHTTIVCSITCFLNLNTEDHNFLISER